MTRHNQKQNHTFKQSIFIAIAFCAFLCLPHPASAFFGDTESANENLFDASSLGIALSVMSQTEDSRLVAVSADQQEGVEYHIFKTSAVGTFCADVQMTISQDGAEIYNGSLESFLQSTSSPLAVGQNDEYDFAFSVLDDDSAYMGDCTVTLSYRANQMGYIHGEAFFDTEVDAFMLLGSDFGTAPSVPSGVVLNEILANPEGNDDQGGLQGEWVELYNNGATAIDLAGWYVKDLAGHTVTTSPATTMNSQTIIYPNSWMVLFMGGEILNNTGDTVTLYNASGVSLDIYAFGDHGTDEDPDSNHTGGGDNDNPAGSETAAQEGKSDARIPDGVGEWIDPIPTPGEHNVLDEVPDEPEEQSREPVFTFTSELSLPDIDIVQADEPIGDGKQVEPVISEPTNPVVVEETQKEVPKEEPKNDEQPDIPEAIKPTLPPLE